MSWSCGRLRREIKNVVANTMVSIWVELIALLHFQEALELTNWMHFVKLQLQKNFLLNFSNFSSIIYFIKLLQNLLYFFFLMSFKLSYSKNKSSIPKLSHNIWEYFRSFFSIYIYTLLDRSLYPPSKTYTLPFIKMWLHLRSSPNNEYSPIDK